LFLDETYTRRRFPPGVVCAPSASSTLRIRLSVRSSSVSPVVVRRMSTRALEWRWRATDEEALSFSRSSVERIRTT
jgi:hypothetical protein